MRDDSSVDYYCVCDIKARKGRHERERLECPECGECRETFNMNLVAAGVDPGSYVNQ